MGSNLKKPIFYAGPVIIPFDGKIAQARDFLHDYMMKIYNNKRLKDWKNFMFIYLQLNRIESENYRAKELLIERDITIKQQGEELRKLRSRNNQLEIEVVEYRKQIESQTHVIEEMSDGLIARCDLCGSEEPV